MSWGSSVHSLLTPRNYEAADRLFKEKPSPRGRKWLEHERPLYNNRAHHYRMVRGSDGDDKAAYYDMVLHHTSMLRYYRPSKGLRTLLLRGFNTSTSWNFIWRFGYGYRTTVHVGSQDGVLILSPDVHRKYTAPNGVTVPEDWSAVLVYDERHGQQVLQAEQSAHRPVYVYRSSAEDKAARAALKKKVEMLLYLFCQRREHYHANARVEHWKGRPFRGHRFDKRVDLTTWKEGAELPEATFAALDSIAQEVYDVALSKREYNAGRLGYGGLTGAEGDVVLAVDTFKAALLRVFVKQAGKDRQSVRVELPQFPTEVPRKHSTWAK